MALRIVHDKGFQVRLGDMLAERMAAANLLGRTQVAQEVYRKTGLRVPLATSSRLHVHFDDDALLPLDATATGGFSLELPATDAANYLRHLTPVTRATYDGLTSQYKRDSFTIAGTTDVRLIQQIRDELASVIQDGGTKEEFEKAAARLATEAGVEQISAFTLDTVFTTNMQKAFALGRFEQQMQPDTLAALPYGQYLTVGDDRVRPEHACLDGFIARMEDRVWAKIYPPNGFNCRCIRVALLASEIPEGYDADESGLARLPLLAQEKVPQAGFSKPWGGLGA